MGREGGQSKYRPKQRGGITRGSGRQFPCKLEAVWDESLGSYKCRVGREACQSLRFKTKGKGSVVWRKKCEGGGRLGER